MQPTPFPVFLRLEGRRCLVVGGNRHAWQKAHQLASAGARVALVAPDPEPDPLTAPAPVPIDVRSRAFRSLDLEGVFLAVVADPDPALQEWISGLATSRRTLVYVMDRAELSDMICGAILDRGDLQVVVSTSGRFPMLASKIRDRLARVLPESAADAVRLLGRARDAIRDQHPADFSARFEAMQRITTDEALDAVEDGDLETLAAVIASEADAPAPSTSPAPTVHIVGAGPGDPGLLTAAALRVLHRADVVFHDSLVSEEILRILPSRVETVPVGRRLGRVVRAQSEIHRGLIEQARAGRRVVRLKGGDPAVFGRVGEETEALAAAGIRVEIVPGVTAAVAAAASARVPLTWRGIAASAVFVSAYHADEAEGPRNGNGASRSDGWENLEHLARHVDTLAVYMGASRGGDVARALLRAGRSPAEGVVVVEHASLPTEEVHWTTLADLAFARSAQRYRRPALILIGPAVAAAQRGVTRAAAAAGSARVGFVPAPAAALREGAQA